MLFGSLTSALVARWLAGENMKHILSIVLLVASVSAKTQPPVSILLVTFGSNTASDKSDFDVFGSRAFSTEFATNPACSGIVLTPMEGATGVTSEFVDGTDATGKLVLHHRRDNEWIVETMKFVPPYGAHASVLRPHTTGSDKWFSLGYDNSEPLPMGSLVRKVCAMVKQSGGTVK